MGSRPKIPPPVPPPPPPDYSDQAVRDASLAERQKQLAGSSRRKSFIGGAGASGGTLPLGVKKLLGS